MTQWAPYAALGVAASGLIYSMYVNRRTGLREARKARVDLERRVTVIETTLDLIMKDAVRILHAPHPEHARRDALLEALEADRIGPTDLAELIRLLEEMRADQDVGAGERLAASTVLRVIEARFR